MLIYQCDRFAVFEPADDNEAVALDNMQLDRHIYYLQFNTVLFQSVCWFDRMIMICSDTELSINPPNIQFKKCLYDAIAKLQNDTFDLSEYSVEEIECIKELPNGWKLSTLKQFTGYRSMSLPEINYEVERLQWYLSAPHISAADHTLFIHPELDRPLTPSEWSAIEQSSSDRPLLAWLASLKPAATARPVPYAAGERIEGNRAVLDWRPLTRYPALEVYPYQNRRNPAHLFNVNADGSLRAPWHLISRCSDGTLTHENFTEEIAAGIS